MVKGCKHQKVSCEQWIVKGFNNRLIVIVYGFQKLFNIDNFFVCRDTDMGLR